MNVPPKPTLKQLSVIIPLLLPIAALALLLGYVATHGIVAEPPHDERAPARVFQLLLVTQAFLVAIFAVRWLPRAPLETLRILAIQACAAFVPIAIVLFLEH